MNEDEVVTPPNSYEEAVARYEEEQHPADEDTAWDC
jgi:hypothetical protein